MASGVGGVTGRPEPQIGPQKKRIVWSRGGSRLPCPVPQFPQRWEFWWCCLCDEIWQQAGRVCGTSVFFRGGDLQEKGLLLRNWGLIEVQNRARSAPLMV